MARGWESKAIEDQQAARDTSPRVAGPELTSEQAARQQQRDSLLLARVRVLSDLQHACRAPHRAMLEAALADLERRLADSSPDGEATPR